MNTAAWVAICASIASHVFTVIWWLVRRPVGRIDRLESAVFGETGVNMRLTKFATAELLDRKLADVNAAMKGISEEGQRREDRILGAIQEQTRIVTTAMTEMRADIRHHGTRVDTLMTGQNGAR
jgi:hypothetical protein